MKINLSTNLGMTSVYLLMDTIYE